MINRGEIEHDNLRPDLAYQELQIVFLLLQNLKLTADRILAALTDELQAKCLRHEHRLRLFQEQ